LRFLKTLFGFTFQTAAFQFYRRSGQRAGTLTTALLFLTVPTHRLVASMTGVTAAGDGQRQIGVALAQESSP
jgi:hypothetical protein